MSKENLLDEREREKERERERERKRQRERERERKREREKERERKREKERGREGEREKKKLCKSNKCLTRILQLSQKYVLCFSLLLSEQHLFFLQKCPGISF